MLTQMNIIYVEKSKDLCNDQWKINVMNELIYQVVSLFSRYLFYYCCICILFNQKLYVLCTFYTMLCTCLVKMLYGINYNKNNTRGDNTIFVIVSASVCHNPSLVHMLTGSITQCWLSLAIL